MHKSLIKCEVLIIGGGVIGLSIGIAMQQSRAQSKVIIIEKEEEVCLHASGRNSGVIHAGFYYSSESLKSKFFRLGNLELKKFCRDKNLQIQEIGKVELGTYITKTDRVIGIQRSTITDISKLPSGQIIGSGTLVWVPQTNKWIRAGHLYGMDLSYLSYQTETVSLFVSPGANYELEDVTIVRDAMEVYSPETKKAYAEKMLAMKLT